MVEEGPAAEAAVVGIESSLHFDILTSTISRSFLCQECPTQINNLQIRATPIRNLRHDCGFYALCMRITGNLARGGRMDGPKDGRTDGRKGLISCRG